MAGRLYDLAGGPVMADSFQKGLREKMLEIREPVHYLITEGDAQMADRPAKPFQAQIKRLCDTFTHLRPLTPPTATVKPI
jgi:hypothetical protein